MDKSQKIIYASQFIDILFDKYKDNEYILQRLETHLFNLPSILEQENTKRNERVSRINELVLEQEQFCKIFLSKNHYFYMPHNDKYYRYNGNTYSIIKEDELHHNILSELSKQTSLVQWKHKTKQNIIKQIKERRNLFKSTPETYTIQNVLNILQTFFHTRTEIKYFLTIIGDCIFKKNNDNLYFVSSHLKTFISSIDYIGYFTCGTSIMNNFITKYHDTHKLTSYRLIRNIDSINGLSTDFFKNMLNNIGIDLLCVATHYSDRYGNADNFLNTKIQEDAVKNHIYYFTLNSIEHIVNDFINQCIQPVTTNDNINWKTMHYIWKTYLSNMNIPNMIYYSNLQSLLSTKLTNAEENGNIVFLNITSKYLPKVSTFLSFWEKHIGVGSNNDEEYEIDELLTLYNNTEIKSNHITDSELVKIIKHYFTPQVDIIDNKYVTNINKCYDDLISFDELYIAYKSYFNAKSVVDKRNYPIISKHFFEKFITTQLTSFIKYDKFIAKSYFINK
jgi:hypothetical protein